MNSDPNQRKKQILDTAIKIFAIKGFEKTRMDDIVAESGLSKGTIYWYYHSKDELIFDLLHQIIGEIPAFDPAAVRKAGSIFNQLTHLVEGLMTRTQDYLQKLPVLLEFYTLATRKTEYRDYFKKYFGEYNALVTELIRAGIQTGEFTPEEQQAEKLATTLIALLEGLVVLFLLNPELFDLAEQSVFSLRQILEGIRRKEKL